MSNSSVVINPEVKTAVIQDNKHEMPSVQPVWKPLPFPFSDIQYSVTGFKQMYKAMIDDLKAKKAKTEYDIMYANESPGFNVTKNVEVTKDFMNKYGYGDTGIGTGMTGNWILSKNPLDSMSGYELKDIYNIPNKQTKHLRGSVVIDPKSTNELMQSGQILPRAGNWVFQKARDMVVSTAKDYASTAYYRMYQKVKKHVFNLLKIPLKYYVYKKVAQKVNQVLHGYGGPYIARMIIKNTWGEGAARAFDYIYNNINYFTNY